jgi:hypothetical protein
MTIYGVGVVGDKPMDEKTEELLKKRPHNQTGTLRLTGFGDEKIDSLSFEAGSGGFTNRGKMSYGVPYGTYVLNRQPIGRIIRKVHAKYGVHTPYVWNVGVPKSPTATGFDPGQGRGRGAIQIHSDPRLKSQGCLVMSPADFNKFHKIALNTPHHMKLEVIPTDKPAIAEYVISPRD